MTVFTVIHLILLAVMMAALLWPIGALRRGGYRRAAWGHGVMAAGLFLARIDEILTLVGLPQEHWSYWPLFFSGVGILLVGTWLVVGGGRGRGGKPEFNTASR
ncbi:MAG: hypothetical protein ACO1SX_07725 [Actinomycetota bacterium]